MKRTTILGICMTALVAFAVWAPNVLAFNNHSSCQSCHSITYDNARHAFHRGATADLGVSCDICHNNNRVVNSCAVCHDAAPLQTRHIDNYGEASCEGCHPQAPPPPACNDKDNDGYGYPGDSSCPDGSATDCNDNNADINPGVAENCTDGIDNNCDGILDNVDPNAIGCPVDCTDGDGDTYSPDGGTCGPTDCADSDASVHPGAFETCDDGVDNNCNGQTDCNDSSCSGDILCECIDYDNRRSCKADSRCSWSGKLKACTEPEVYTELGCLDAGGRWNKKKETCTIR